MCIHIHVLMIQEKHDVKMEEEIMREEEMEVAIIDIGGGLSSELASKQIVKACEEVGFFKVINHGVPPDVISRLDDETRDFFSRPLPDKLRLGPAQPYGYGRHNIGFNGDTGQVEYLVLHTNPNALTNLPSTFRCAAKRYVDCVKEVACHILDLIHQGLSLSLSQSQSHHTSGGCWNWMSEMVRDSESDSLLRLNHYPPGSGSSVIGFGPHTDPQILTLLRSDASHGLHIHHASRWVPVTPFPLSSFSVNVGDMLQVLTNGRFKSVKHRAVVNPHTSRTSIAYFAAPSLDATITCPHPNPLYSTFTWGDYKRATYATALEHNRLDLFKL